SPPGRTRTHIIMEYKEFTDATGHTDAKGHPSVSIDTRTVLGTKEEIVYFLKHSKAFTNFDNISVPHTSPIILCEHALTRLKYPTIYLLIHRCHRKHSPTPRL